MKRGEVWVASGPSYAGKPRPVLVVQDEAVVGFESTIVCLVTSYESGMAPNRVAIEPSAGNGLERESWVMTDKVYTLQPQSMRRCIGKLTSDEMAEVSERLRKVLGL